MQRGLSEDGRCAAKSGRPILYSLCQYGNAKVWEWGAEVGGNCWRTTGDISDSWEFVRMARSIPHPASQDGLRKDRAGARDTGTIRTCWRSATAI